MLSPPQRPAILFSPKCLRAARRDEGKASVAKRRPAMRSGLRVQGPQRYKKRSGRVKYFSLHSRSLFRLAMVSLTTLLGRVPVQKDRRSVRILACHLILD